MVSIVKKMDELNRNEEKALKCLWLLIFLHFKKINTEELGEYVLLNEENYGFGKKNDFFPKNSEEMGHFDNKNVSKKLLKERHILSCFFSLYDVFWEMVKMDHPDVVLLRFLRARKWDTSKSFIMLATTVYWRKEIGVEEILRKGEAGAIETGDDAFMKQLRLGKSFIQGVDRENRPICYIRTHLHRAGEQPDLTIHQYTILLMESARLMITYPVQTATILFDLTKFSLKNMDYIPIKFLIKCFEAHYPESLGICIIHKAPWVFQGIWKVIKTWLDPVVVKKVCFTNSNEDLEVYIKDTEIIKELGGKKDWEYKYIEPKENENIKMQDILTKERLLLERKNIINSFEQLTIKWIKESDIAQSDLLLEQRNFLAKNIESNYWQLDPYIRARTFYDRTGSIFQA
ncbi:hypothetical protein T552_00218 [Pneumocystis carinii B80]|uniref:CRAL-TRIO domain-containing protein n=1 Tax=Pneumocystis carinii (strain B80) TaxID=1408658 RepID=A0A0W4ZT79_PNEC8|nr:hypothetical protein T552_00218 [Pneumocystis carinii B80]KTW31580.1 hypothetical protein T552_00218 [Pneumocystis carinii B80]